MAVAHSEESERVRTAEVIASISLATDLGMGLPFEHGLHATLIAMRLCELLGVDPATSSDTYYASMLMYTGCTTDARKNAEVFGGSRAEHITPRSFGSFTERLAGVLLALPPDDAGALGRVVETARRLPKAVLSVRGHFTALCEVAEMLSERLGLSSEVAGLFLFLTERWDGKSVLRRSEGDEIPLPLRISQLAHDAAYQRHIGGVEHAREVVAGRAGGAFDPDIAGLFVDSAGEMLAVAEAGEMIWDEILTLEPTPNLMLEDGAIDRALSAIGHFADLMAPALAGHSWGVSQLVSKAGVIVGLDDDELLLVCRAAMIHDVGRVAVDPSIWSKQGPLSADEMEKVRLHPYYTERVLSRSPFLKSMAEIACSHHERLDGSGYHRGIGALSMPRPSRLLAAADSFQAMTEPRPFRPAMGAEVAAAQLVEQAEEGWLDPDMVAGVVEAAGEPTPDVDRPAGLTGREVEVIGLLARGLQTKQVADRLGISPKTADAHIQNAYRKIGVSTRAAATLFAMEHGLVV